MTEAELLASLSNRADVAGRRVYADFLEEKGRPQYAELLRVQVQAAEHEARLLALAPALDRTWLEAAGDVARPIRLTLASGRDVAIEELRQVEVYAGLLEGLPTKERNPTYVQRVMRQAGEGAYLIPPVETPLESAGYTSGTPSSLPEVACTMRLRSFNPARDPKRDGSILAVVWFQWAYAFPIEPLALAQLLTVDWETHATDFDY